jgi:hypothetical protein
LAYNFNNDPSTAALPADPFAPPGTETRGPLSTAPAAAAEPAAATSSGVMSDNPASAAATRFSSCRWQQAAEEGNAAFCTHREVKPYAGTAGFDPGAWCPDCQYYKLRRAPKKRPTDEYSY